MGGSVTPRRRRWGRLARIAALCLLVPVAWPVGPVASQTPTSDQIRIFQSLPPDQREAAMDAIRQGGDLRVEPRAGRGPFGLPGGAEDEGAVAATTEGEPRAGEWKAGRGPDPVEGGAPPRVRPGDVLVVDTWVPPDPVNEGEEPAEGIWRQVRYPVDRDGRLWVPGEMPLAVLGWTVDEVGDALSSLPFGAGHRVRVRLVPRADRLTGLDLKPFGYELFADHAQAYRPDPNAPVAKDYMVGPGDTFLIQLFGKESAQYELGVTRDGTLLIPKFGPLQVAGLPFDEARRLVTDRVKAQAIGVDVSVTMGPLRTIQVFVLGDVVQPGMQILSAFGTPLHALLAAQGVRPNGSLRNIEVKRGGTTVNRIDLYDVLLSGDTGGYGRLQPGDVVFVPPVSGLVAVAGLVRRPAIYELKGGETVAGLLALAGGVSAEADTAAIRVRRPDPMGGQRILDLDPDMLDTPVADGDLVQVFPRVGPVTGSVTVRGHVEAPGVFAWTEGLRLLDLFPSPAGLLPDTDPAFILILRLEDGDPVFLQENLTEALADPEGSANAPLADRDEVFTFARDEDRAALLQPQVDRLARLAVAGRVPDRTVEVRGQVHFPGRYPLTRGMRLTDLITAAGEANERAYPYEVEITRFAVAPHGERRETEHLLVDLSRARQADPEHDVVLRPDDRVNVRAMPEWQGESVTLTGEVRFPGVYVIESGETLSSLIARAGGLTQEAFPPGAVFRREQVRVQEQAELDRLARTFEQDLVRAATEPATFGSGDRGQALSAGRELLRLVRQTRATGRMSLTLERNGSGVLAVKEATLRLMEGDHLHIPRRPDSVLVLGEVYHPTAHLFRKAQSVRDYVNLSGGITKRGNRGEVLVIHANGSVTSVKVGRMSSGGRVALGDTIVVPQRIVTFSSLKLATDVTQILYQLAITAASAKAIGVF